MYIAIHTASAAVRRTLEMLITASGHLPAKKAAEAELTLVDQLHPSPDPLPSSPQLALAAATTDDTILACPLRPQALTQYLIMRGQAQCIVLGAGWSLDILARTLLHPQAASITLTEKECSLLKILAQAQAEPLTREALLEKVWGMASDVDTHTLETHIYRLRAKLHEISPSPCDIITQNGIYTLVLLPVSG